MPPLYYAVRETEHYADVTLHADRACPDGPVRAAPDSVDGEHCPECTDAGENEPETCVVELSAGGICGREKPCPYHDSD